MLNYNTIGKRIALLRKERGYTQEQMSGFLNVTPQAVSKWEKGHSLPDTASLPLLAKILDVSIDCLLMGSNLREITSPYDAEYQRKEYYWGLGPSFLAEQVVKVINGGVYDRRLLDIGSGEGRDSIYFAKCGLNVDSLEISMPGIEKIKQYSQSAGCVARYYYDWEIIQCEERIIDCNSANMPHQHAVNYELYYCKEN